MTSIEDVVYCLACRKPMPAMEAACPACGANQQEARAARITAAPAAKAARPPRPAAPSAAPRTETVPCPNCKVPVAPEISRCGYCGHMMDDPDAQSRFDTGYSKIYAGIGIFLALLALSPIWVFPRQGIILGAAALAMGKFAQAENRYDVLGGVAVFMGIGCGLIGGIARFALAAYFATH